jgi:hypothetical protein
VDGITLRKGSRIRVLLANLRSEPRVVRLVGLVPAKVRVGHLDADNAERAMRLPESFGAEPTERARLVEGKIELAPYSVARLDWGKRG